MKYKNVKSIIVAILLAASLYSNAVSVYTIPPAKKAKVAKKPNVLFIAIDDLNDWVSCLAVHPQARTPNIDRLAAMGVLFTNAHIQAPLCNPSRSSVLTGMRPSSTGIYGLNPGFREVEVAKNYVSLPQYFRKEGYFTAGYGKVFHDGSIPKELQNNEFDVWGPAPSIPIPSKKFVQTPRPIGGMDWGIEPENEDDQADCGTHGPWSTPFQ